MVAGTLSSPFFEFFFIFFVAVCMVACYNRCKRRRQRWQNVGQRPERVKKGMRDEYKTAADSLGLSLAGLVTAAVDEYIERHR